MYYENDTVPCTLCLSIAADTTSLSAGLVRRISASCVGCRLERVFRSSIAFWASSFSSVESAIDGMMSCALANDSVAGGNVTGTDVFAIGVDDVWEGSCEAELGATGSCCEVTCGAGTPCTAGLCTA